MPGDVYELERFVRAQSANYADALGELRAGRKRTHWMWYVFPQARGLGHSSMAERYGVASLEEARAYLAHPVLGPRLAECADAMLGHADKSLNAILGSPDDMKFISSMSLFRLAQGEAAGPFQKALEIWNGGALDPRTVGLMAR
jgi:uncharacterized protein (DUF1810 family)